ncbi:MAG: TlpA family protein disulfide reductase [Herpetosiphonaceae bacterium]|nr:TlpA family protein disulfide reductase [Herpetosiphonaceae bacterium]
MLLVLLVLLAGCSVTKPLLLGPQPWPDKVIASPEVGRRAPNFKLATTSGATVSLDQLHGKPVILNFFATWCTSCKQEMPLLQRASQAVQVVGVDLRDERAAVAAFAQQNDAHYPLLLDTGGDVNESYRVGNLPMTYVMDGDGTIRTVVIGAVTEPKLRTILAQVGLPPLP